MTTPRSNGMPLVHHARRMRANWEAANPFTTRESLAAHLAALETRYLDPRTSEKVARALHVEIDLVAEVLDAEPATPGCDVGKYRRPWTR